jgi:hypothetical protein
MLPVQFCNYNLDYQQRLGFLKVVAWAGRNVRGGKEELQRKIESLYGKAGDRPKKAGRLSSNTGLPFDPEILLRHEEVPSWQPGFSSQRIDRLVLWAEMLGLVTPAGRLAEWSKPLIEDEKSFDPHLPEANPFLLSGRDRSYFLALLMFHDHVLFHLASALARLEPGRRIDARRACIEVTKALCLTLDCAAGVNIHAARSRQMLRDLLERLAGTEHISNKHAFLNLSERENAFQQMEARTTRNHLAEYHAVCRFEQLTDLGLLVKEDPSKPSITDDARERARKSWAWYTTAGLRSFCPDEHNGACNVEDYLESQWAKSCFLGQRNATELDPIKDQVEIAKLFDGALPRARRQLGAIQVHTWVFIAALDAIDRGMSLEFKHAYALLDAIRHDQRYSGYLRQSGQQTYLGRTASLIAGSMYDNVCQYPITSLRGSL